jgi:hypothetical protein
MHTSMNLPPRRCLVGGGRSRVREGRTFRQLHLPPAEFFACSPPADGPQGLATHFGLSLPHVVPVQPAKFGCEGLQVGLM